MAKKPTKSRYVSPPSPAVTTPLDEPGGWWLYVPVVWRGYLIALHQFLEQPELWEGTPEDVETCVGIAQELQLAWVKDVDMLKDVRANNGRLEKLVGGVWIDAGALDDFTVSAHNLPPGSMASATFLGGNIDFGIPEGVQGLPGTQGAKGEPGTPGVSSGSYQDFADKAVLDPNHPDAADRYCFAAHALTKEYVDAAVDLLEVTRFGVSQSSSQIQWVAAGLLGWLPWVDDVSQETLEWITETIESSLTFAIAQMGDSDAQNLAAEQIFCALQKSYPNFQNVFDYIDYPSLMPAVNLSLSPTSGVLALWENFDNIIDFCIDTFFTGEEWGWLVLLVGELLQKTSALPVVGGAADAVKEGFGYPANLDTVVPQIMANAEFFDDRDCSGYEDCFPPEDWCVRFDFTISDYGWIPAQGYQTIYESGVGWKAGDSNNLDRVFIRYVFPAQLNITKIKFFMSALPDGAAWICPNDGGINCGYIDNPITTTEPQITGNYQISQVSLGAEEGAAPQQIWGYITAVEISGQGQNPWDGQGIDCPSS